MSSKSCLQPSTPDSQHGEAAATERPHWLLGDPGTRRSLRGGWRPLLEPTSYWTVARPRQEHAGLCKDALVYAETRDSAHSAETVLETNVHIPKIETQTLVTVYKLVIG